jgi:ribosomal-protein-alanine N-acetyltransferase
VIEFVNLARADAERVSTLHAVCFEEAWSVEFVGRLLAIPGNLALLARSGGKDVGFVLARVAADEAEILSIGVPESARGKGIASAMLAAAARSVAQAGATKLFLEVASENRAARTLYSKLGFRDVGRRPGYYREGAGEGLILRADLPLADLGNCPKLD